MTDDESLRIKIREEIERYIPLLRGDKQLLTIPECMQRYRRRHSFIVTLIRRGELAASYLPKGKNGRPQYMVRTESAERHPLLGGTQ